MPIHYDNDIASQSGDRRDTKNIVYLPQNIITLLMQHSYHVLITLFQYKYFRLNTLQFEQRRISQGPEPKLSYSK